MDFCRVQVGELTHRLIIELEGSTLEITHSTSNESEPVPSTFQFDIIFLV